MGWSNRIRSAAGRLSGGAATGRRTGAGGRGVGAAGRGGAARPAGSGAGGMLRKFLKRR